jgi:hypothetical protein
VENSSNLYSLLNTGVYSNDVIALTRKIIRTWNCSEFPLDSVFLDPFLGIESQTDHIFCENQDIILNENLNESNALEQSSLNFAFRDDFQAACRNALHQLFPRQELKF